MNDQPVPSPLSDYLVSADWLHARLNDPAIRIVEVGALGPPTYGDGHIPGALHWPWKETLWDRERREFLGPAAFAALLGRSGVTPETTLVFYSDRAQFATYAFWACLMGGHARACVLDGSRTRWVADGRPMTTDAPAIAAFDYPLRPTDETSRIGRDGVLAGLTDPNRILLDARTDEEFLGQRVKPAPNFDHGAERKGHIPGARHLFYRDLLHEDETFRSPPALRAAFAARSATPDKDIVAYCRLSHRASLLWFAARFLLGYPRFRVYDGSWTEWGSMVGMPVTRLVYEDA